jgi:capsid protein
MRFGGGVVKGRFGFEEISFKAPRGGVLGLAREFVAYQTAKFKTARMGYDAARQVIETGEAWDTVPRSESARLQDDLPDMMARSDAMWRNNGVYSGLLNRAVDNIVGSGIHVNPMTESREKNRDLSEAFRDDMMDADKFGPGGFDFYTGQRLALLDCLRGGNSLWYRSDAGWQLFEPAQVGTPMGYDTDLRRIQQGVELDGSGRPARYWVGPFAAWGYVDLAKAAGLRADLCVLVGNREYVSGHRSVPALATQLERFVHLDKYLESELVGARMASSIVATVKSADKNVMNAFQTGLKSAADKEGTNQVAPLSKRVKLAPASIIPLLKDEEFQLHQSNRPTSVFPDYVRLMFRICGMKIGMPLEIGLLDFSEANFSSAKLLMMQARLTWGQWQELVMGPLVHRVYLDWLGRQTRVDLKSVKNPARHVIDYPKPPWIDVLKEAMGRREGVNSGWLSNTGVAREMGNVIEDVVAERAEEFKAAIAAVIHAGFKAGSDEYKQCLAHVVGNFGDYRTDLIKAGFLKTAENDPGGVVE